MRRLLRAAIIRGYRPTTLLRRVQPHSKWDDLDFDLVSALDQLDRDTSEVTGLPWWMTRTGHPELIFQVDTVEDGAERALDQYDEKQKKKPGVRRFVVPVGVGDFEVEGGLARERMLRFAAAQADETAAEDDELAALGVETARPPGGWNAAEYGG